MDCGYRRAKDRKLSMLAREAGAKHRAP